MDLTQLANLGEFIGGAVVVVSLLYLAIQARQSAQQQRSANYGVAVDRVSQILSEWARDGELNRILVDGSTAIESLQPYDRIRFSWNMNHIFSMYEFIYHQYQSNVLPGYVWTRYSRHVEFWSSLPGVRTWWETNPGAFTEAFTEVVQEKLLSEGLSIDDAIDYWGIS